MPDKVLPRAIASLTAFFLPAKRLLRAIASFTAFFSPAGAIAFFAALSALAACHQHSNKQQLLTINEGLTRSFTFIQNSTDLEYQLLQNRLYDPLTKYRAEQWSPGVIINKEGTRQVINYIDTLEAGLAQSQPLTAEITKSLFDTLIHFKHDLINAFPDSLVAANPDRKKDWDNYCRHFPLLHALPDTLFSESNFKAWADTTVDNDPFATLLALNKLKIDIAISAQLIAQYCKWETEPRGDHFTVLRPLINLNSSVVQPGEAIEITAGIGSYSASAEPKVTVAGNPIPLNESAVAAYAFKASGQPGRHSIPIKIEWYLPDGTLASYTKPVFYYVTPLPTQ